MSSNVATFFNLTLQLLQRNNPIQQALEAVTAFINLVFNYQSDVKLNKFRQSLYMQQMRRMENYLSQASPYQYQGNKIDRRF
jgi:hypothetical protein